MAELKNSKWEEFARLSAAGYSRGDAYAAAGFEPKSKSVASKRGSALAGRPEIRSRIVELEDELNANTLARAGVDREWVLKELRANVARSTEAIPVRDRQGRETGKFTFNAAGANRALELLGKELGLFVERFSVESLDSQLDGMTGEELRDFVKKAALETGVRLLDMSDDELKTYIYKTAPRLGLRVEEAPKH